MADSTKVLTEDGAKVIFTAYMLLAHQHTFKVTTTVEGTLPPQLLRPSHPLDMALR
jgi:hypothetical protein